MALHVRCHKCCNHFTKLYRIRILQYVTQVHKHVVSEGKWNSVCRDDEKSSTLVHSDEPLKWRWDNSSHDKACTDVNAQLSVHSKHRVLPIFSIENVECLLNTSGSDKKLAESKSLAGIITPFTNTCDDIIMWNSVGDCLSENDVLKSGTDAPQPHCKLPVRNKPGRHVQDLAAIRNKALNFHVDLFAGQSEDLESTPPSYRPSKDQLLVVYNFLSEKIPKFFGGKLDIHILHPDVILENNYWGKSKITHGINAYAMEMIKIKVLSHLKFSKVAMEIVSMTVHTEDGSVKVRWRVKGLSQLRAFQFWKLMPWMFKKFLASEKHYQWYEGFSVFYVGKDGLVHKLLLDRMMPDEPLCDDKTAGTAAKLGLVFALSPKPSLTDIQGFLLQSCLHPTSN